MNWVIDNYREGSWGNVVTSVSTLFQNAHGGCSIKWDGSVKGVAKAGRVPAKKRIAKVNQGFPNKLKPNRRGKLAEEREHETG